MDLNELILVVLSNCGGVGGWSLVESGRRVLPKPGRGSSDLHPCPPASIEDCHRGCPVNGGHSSVPGFQGPVLSEGAGRKSKEGPVLTREFFVFICKPSLSSTGEKKNLPSVTGNDISICKSLRWP